MLDIYFLLVVVEYRIVTHDSVLIFFDVIFCACTYLSSRVSENNSKKDT